SFGNRSPGWPMAIAAPSGRSADTAISSSLRLRLTSRSKRRFDVTVAELGVDRRPADLAVEEPQLLAKVSHYPRHHRIDAAKKMVPRNTTFEVEEIEQLALIDILPTHHDPPPLPRTSGRRNHDSSTTTSDFFNTSTRIGPRALCRRLTGCTVVPTPAD